MTTTILPSISRPRIVNFPAGKILVAAIIFIILGAIDGTAQSGYGWHQLANSNMSSVCLGNVPTGQYTDNTMTTTENYLFNCNQIIPWSSGVGDTVGNRMIVWGGGHTDYAGDEVQTLGLTSNPPAWTEFRPPTYPVPWTGDGKNWEGLNPYFVRAADGGILQQGATPASRHTYAGVVFVPTAGTAGRMYSFGGSLANSGNYSAEIWYLDMASGSWALTQPYSQLSATTHYTTAYNPTTGHVVVYDTGTNLYDYNPSAGTLTLVNGGFPGAGITLSPSVYGEGDGATSAVDPVNNQLVVVWATDCSTSDPSSCVPNNPGYPTVPYHTDITLTSLTTYTTVDITSTAGCDLVYRNGGITWDSKLGLMVGYPGGGNQVYLLNTGAQNVVTPFGTVAPHQCLDVPISLNPSPVKGVDYPQDPEGTSNNTNLGIYGRFAYLPSLDSFGMVNDGTKNAWTVQLTGGSPAPSYAASISPGTVSVPEGSQGTSVVTTTVSGGFSNSITPTAVALPQGVTASFSPATIAAPGAGSSTLTITVPASTPAGTYPFIISTFGGGDTINQAATLIVTSNGPPSFALTASPASVTVGQGNQGTSTITASIAGTFNSAIALSASGMPSGTTVSFSPQTIPAPGAGTSTMTITVGASTPTGTYPITVTGNGGGIQQNTIVTLTVGVQQPTFTISATPSSLTIVQGNGGASGIATIASGGFNSAISLSASGVPSGTTVTFTPQTISAPGTGASGMYIAVGSSTPVGTYPITVTGNGGGIQQSTTVTLTVLSSQQPSFAISASPASLSIPQGNQGTSTITTSVSGGFSSAITLSAAGAPSGTTVSFNPNPIPAPGSGTSTMTVTVGASTATGTYPVTVTGNGGGIQQNTTVTLTVTSAGGGGGGWQQGFDFRNTPTFVTDPSGDTYVLSTTAYPTKGNGATYGWVKTSPVSARDRSTSVDPRLAGINYVNNASPATFQVQLPSSGTYNLSLAMGDDGYTQCTTQCQVQFLDGSTVLATVTGGSTNAGYFYDAKGKNWSAAAWPGSNLSQQVTLAGSLLTVVVGTGKATGDNTPVAFLGVAQVSGSPNYAISASPSSLTVQQGKQGTSTITTTISGGFNSAISLSASGVPSGTTVSFNPQTIPAPGSGSSTMSITVGASTPTGTYPITVTGNGGGIQQTATVTLTVTATPNFTISASPASLTVVQGNNGTSTITTAVSGGFNSSISLSASSVPSGTTVSFNPNPIPAPGSGTSTMTITVGASTATGTYPITVTGNGGGVQQNTTVTLTVTAAGAWQQGFDFRNTASYVTDPAGDTYVLSTTAYPTKGSGVTYGWVKTSLVNARDRNAKLDPRLAGVNYVTNGSPATFEVGLPSAGTYNLSLALGDAGYQACWVQCQIQFLDGSTVLDTVTVGSEQLGYFYDTQGKNWSAAQWPKSNLSQQVTLTGSVLTMVVGTSKATGDNTPLAFLGVTQVSGGGSPNYTISASPATLSVQQGNQGSSTITTSVSGGFNSAIGLSASGVPSGTTVSFNPQSIPAPGSGSSTMTISVGAGTAVGTYPITVTGSGGGIQQNTTVTLTVTSDPNFTISASPSSLSIQQGNQGASTITTAIIGTFNSAISLSSSGAPSGTTVSFNPNPIPAPGSGNSTMTITVGASTAAGTYPITVTGSGGGAQQYVTVTLTVTSSGGGGGGGNGIVVYSTSGSPQTNRPVSIGRFFKDGDIPNFAQAVVGGNPILTQCDVKNRWPDGSLKFAIVSFVLPSVPTAGISVAFENQATGNNSGFLQKADMLAAGYNFEAAMALSGSGASPTISARNMLSNGSFTYWLQGPVVTAVIIEDRANRSYDVNADGAAGNPLHPIYEAWFYPENNSVQVGFTLENTWSSHIAQNGARDQTFALTLSTGESNPVTQLSQPAFTQYGFTRWRRAYFINPPVAGCTDVLCDLGIDYGWNYLSTTGAYPNFDPTYAGNKTVQSCGPIGGSGTAIGCMDALYASDIGGANAGRLTIPGIDNPSGNGGVADYNEAVNTAGYSPWIGLYPQWDVVRLVNGDVDPTLTQMSTNNADLSGRFPIFFREADSSIGVNSYYDCTAVNSGTGNCTSGTIAPQGYNVSVNARQQATLNLYNWASCPGAGTESIAYHPPTDGSQWYQEPQDTSHVWDLAYVPYTLTGKYYYLEHEQLLAGFDIGNVNGCYSAASSALRQGHYGLVYGVSRAYAWAIRTLAYAAFISVDGQPQGPYFLEKLQNNIAMTEGEHNMSLDVSNIDTTWAWTWGQSPYIFSQANNVSQDPMQLWRFGDCADGTFTCYVAGGGGAANNLNSSIVLGAQSWFMTHFVNLSLGMVNQLGLVNTTAMLTRNAHLPIHVALDPSVNHYLQDQYVYPTVAVGGGCTGNLPLGNNCSWFANYTTWQTGFLTQPSNYSTSAEGSDYGAQALGELSFMTNITVDGYSGLNAYNVYKAANNYLPGLCYGEPQWCILP